MASTANTYPSSGCFRKSTNGLREPDWRWYLAYIAKVEGYKPKPKYYDTTTIQLTEYLNGGEEQIVVPSLSQRVSVKELIAIKEDRLTRLSFEARVLGYRDVGIAAQRSQIPIDLAMGYCDIFFDVPNRLGANRSIASKVILARRQRSDNLRRELYRAAYFAGPIVAEHWIQHLPALDANAEIDLSCRAGIERERLALTLLLDGATAELSDPKFGQVYRRLLEQEPQSRTYAEAVFDRVVSTLVSNQRDLSASQVEIQAEEAAKSNTPDVARSAKSRHAA